MSNRKGGHYDGAGNWWAPADQPLTWRHIVNIVLGWVVLLAGTAAFVGMMYLVFTSPHSGEDWGCYDGSRTSWTSC